MFHIKEETVKNPCQFHQRKNNSAYREGKGKTKDCKNQNTEQDRNKKQRSETASGPGTLLSGIRKAVVHFRKCLLQFFALSICFAEIGLKALETEKLISRIVDYRQLLFVDRRRSCGFHRIFRVRRKQNTGLHLIKGRIQQ